MLRCLSRLAARNLGQQSGSTRCPLSGFNWTSKLLQIAVFEGLIWTIPARQRAGSARPPSKATNDLRSDSRVASASRKRPSPSAPTTSSPGQRRPRTAPSTQNSARPGTPAASAVASANSAYGGAFTAEPETNGWAALTTSELTVARLVAEGLTNREVAERLFVSPHTVNSHLRHVFSKLGITSRVELARVARDYEIA
jgi:DNA-binding CsgD family transcriptional regulator